jgi:hypothetical protein
MRRSGVQGGFQQIREGYRYQKGLPVLEATLQDLRYGFGVPAGKCIGSFGRFRRQLVHGLTALRACAHPR